MLVPSWYAALRTLLMFATSPAGLLFAGLMTAFVGTSLAVSDETTLPIRSAIVTPTRESLNRIVGDVDSRTSSQLVDTIVVKASDGVRRKLTVPRNPVAPLANVRPEGKPVVALFDEQARVWDLRVFQDYVLTFETAVMLAAKENQLIEHSNAALRSQLPGYHERGLKLMGIGIALIALGMLWWRRLGQLLRYRWR